MCSFARLACCRRRPASSHAALASLPLFRWRFYFLFPRPGGRAGGARAAGWRAAARRPPAARDRMLARRRARVHVLKNLFASRIHRASVDVIAVLVLERPCRAQSARLPLEAPWSDCGGSDVPRSVRSSSTWRRCSCGYSTSSA